MKHIIVILGFTLLYCDSLKSQQSSLSSLYMIDKYAVNPAYAGFDRSLSINFNYRNQWTGINSNPNQLYVNAHLPIYLINGGVGLMLARDNAGVINRTEFSASVNRVFDFPLFTISTGLRLGFQQNQIDGSEIITPEGIYNQNIFSHEDPILSENITSGVHPNWSIATYIKSSNIEGGISLGNYAPKALNVGLPTIANLNQLAVFGTYSFIIQRLTIQPSFLLRSNFDYIQLDISTLVKSGNIFGGISLRGYNDNSFDSLVIIGGIHLNPKYTIAYSYDIGISDLRLETQGSHEITINYNLNKLIGIGLPPEIIYNPRNF